MGITTEIRRMESRLKALGLKPHNITAVIAKRVGVNRTTYERWRDGETEPSHSKWLRAIQCIEKIKEDLTNGKHVLAKRRRRNARKPRKSGVLRRTDRR